MAEIYLTIPVEDLAMYNDEHKYTACMQAMNEQFKSAFLKLIQQNHEAVKSFRLNRMDTSHHQLSTLCPEY
ncbi:hypothetical protein [Escherichia coli]|uniref:hypothetical protein n=1 Tax=Escherichia coli TaxID=562 RepID=UPI003B284A17